MEVRAAVVVRDVPTDKARAKALHRDRPTNKVRALNPHRTPHKLATGRALERARGKARIADTADKLARGADGISAAAATSGAARAADLRATAAGLHVDRMKPRGLPPNRSRRRRQSPKR